MWFVRHCIQSTCNLRVYDELIFFLKLSVKCLAQYYGRLRFGKRCNSDPRRYFRPAHSTESYTEVNTRRQLHVYIYISYTELLI